MVKSKKSKKTLHLSERKGVDDPRGTKKASQRSAEMREGGGKSGLFLRGGERVPTRKRGGKEGTLSCASKKKKRTSEEREKASSKHPRGEGGTSQKGGRRKALFGKKRELCGKESPALSPIGTGKGSSLML